jgi:Domain of unknown function DUF11/Beta-propeller repeat
MGNGLWSGRRSGRSCGKELESRQKWPLAFGAMLALVMAGSMLLVSGSGGYAQKITSETPAASFPAPIPSPTPASIPTPPRSFQSDRLPLNRVHWKPLSSKPHSKPDPREILGQLPLIFEPNLGQTDPQVKFLARGAGYNLFLDPTGAVLAMQRTRQTEQWVRMKLVGANLAASVVGTGPLPGKSNYILGNDPKHWHTGISQFAGVRYQSVYPGIDLVFYGNQGRLEYDFRVAPGGDPAQAELQFDGASKLEVAGGDLVLTGNDEGGLRLLAPRVYQHEGGRQKPVGGRFVLRGGNRVGFEIGAYDHKRELIIDPVLRFSTYFGGSGSDTLPSVSVNGNGNIYIAGTTTSPQPSFTDYNVTSHTSIPGTLVITPTGPSHIFVAQINPSQPLVLYETFIGGTGSDASVGLAVDSGGNAYLVGNTASVDFPTFGFPYQTAPETKTQCAGSLVCTSVFVSVLNATGTALTYSSYLSGNGNDQASGMTIDLNADVFVTGSTTSNDTPSSTDAFPATFSPAPYQSAPKASPQFFVTKINTGIPSVGGIAYSTYFGGSTSNPVPAIVVGGGIAVDPTGNIYFNGTTNYYNSGSGAYGNGQTEDFPILNAYQPCLDTPPPVVLANPNPCSPPATVPYPTDAFLAKLNPNAAQTVGPQLIFSTFLGGTGSDTGTAIAIDSGAQNIYLTGSTNSPDFVLPTATLAFQGCLNNPGIVVTVTSACPATSTNTDAYVARTNNPTLSTTATPNNVGLTYFSYLGGGGNDTGLAIAVLDATNTSLGDAVVTGATNSGPANPPNFPVTSVPIQSTLNGVQNAFFAQIDTTTTAGQTGVGSYVTYFGGNGVDRGTSIAVDPNLNSYIAGDTNSTANLVTFNPLQATLTPGATSNAFIAQLGTATDLCITCVAPILSATGTVSAGNQITVTFTVANEGPDPATNITVTGAVTSGATFVNGNTSAGTCSAPNNNSVVCLIPTLQSGASSTVAFTVVPNDAGQYSVTASVFGSNNTNTNNTSSQSFTTSGYTVAILPPAQAVSAGTLATFGVLVNPTAGVFGSNVSFSCSALPAGSACNFSPSSVSLINGAQQSTLNLTTTAQPVSTVGSAKWRRSLYALWLMVPGMALLGLSIGTMRGKKKRLLGLLMLSVFFALILLQPSCSSTKTPPPVSGTPSGVYSLTVTVTSGSYSKTVPFGLTVRP